MSFDQTSSKVAKTYERKTDTLDWTATESKVAYD